MRRTSAWYSRASIKHKLVLLILSVSAVMLFLTAALSLAQTLFAGRQRLHRVLEVNANLLAEYCVVPLSFDDREEADRMLSRIQFIPGMVAAGLYTMEGRAFARHALDGWEVPDRLDGVAGRFTYGDSAWWYYHAVSYQGVPLGTLALSASTGPLRAEVLRQAGILAAILLILILVAYALALRMQSLISRPILDLAEATRRVSEQGDLTQRVHRDHQDEIGVLYDGYNRMLDQLQARQMERDKAEEESRIRQQQLLEAGKLVTLGTLVSGVAHEINNPNAYIMLSASLALKKLGLEGGAPPPDGEAAARMRSFLPEVLENIHRSSQRIDTIVKRLKDYYRRDLARVKEPVDLNEVVENAIEIVDAKIRAATRHFRFLPGDGLPRVLGNFQELEQVAINLIENACQALPNPEKQVEVVTAEGEPGTLLLVVRDEGTGIPKDYLDRITDPFFTTKREVGGTGLGLSLALSILNDHGGQLRFDSVQGSGTTATVVLPALALPGRTTA